MGENQKNLLWQAYIDGELTACEAAEFEESLSAEELARLTGEMRLESSLSDTLNKKMICPPSTWSRVKNELSAAGMDGVIAPPFYRSPAFYGSVGALAAAIILMISVVNSPIESTDLFIPVDIPLDLTGATEADINSHFTKNNMNLLLSAPPDDRHPIELKGMRYAMLAGEDVIELFYTCCGEPVDIVLVRKGSNAEKAFNSDTNRSRIQAVKEIGDFRAALLSVHPSKDLLDLVAAR